MRTQKNTNLPFHWQRRLYLIGSWLCLLGLVGMGILFLTPEETPTVWAAQTTPLDEALTGNAGGSVRPAPTFFSNGESHNEGKQGLDASVGVEGERPSWIASSSVDSQPERPLNALDFNPAGEAPPNTLAQAFSEQSTDNTPPRPDPAKRGTAASESGMGEITITALMPGTRVDVANHVVTEAPTTLRVPWPANYTIAVQVDEATVYETQVRLSAENTRLSFAVDSEAGVD